MNKLIEMLINKRRITLFIAIIIAALGAQSYYLLPRQESPDLSVPYAMVITIYPGASAKDVNDLVSKPIEEELAELDGCDYTKTISKDSVSIAVIAFENGTDNDKAMQDVRNAVVDVKGDLPSDCHESEINTDLIKAAGMIISLSGENYSYEQLASFGDLFKDGLADIDGVSEFTIEGELDKEVNININVSELNHLGVSLEDVYNLLRSQNLEIPSGDISTENGKVKVKTPGIYESIEDIRNTIIGVSSKSGVVTRLSDVADVEMKIEEGVEKFKQDSKNAVLLTGYFKKGENVVIIGKDVRKVINKVKKNLPEDLIVNEVIYQPDDVSKSTNDFMMNLVEGILLVVVVVFLGMGMRNAVVVSAAIPLSILMTFGVMSLSKIYIHQMSLTALIIALGILVDNAIVISDTIQVKIDEGENVTEASYKGTSESSIPIFTATLTTVAAFSPLLGIPGAAGEFLLSIPLVLIISIIAAYVVSMFITPAMAAIFFKKSKKKKTQEGKLRMLFKNLLKLGLKKRGPTVVSVFILLILIINILMPMLPQEFFPFADKNLFYIDIYSEVTGDIDATEKLTDDVIKILSKEKEINSYTVAVGNGVPKFYVTMDPATPSDDYAQMVCKFDLEKSDRFKNNNEFASYIQRQLDENVSSGTCSVNLLQLADPGTKIDILVSAKKIDKIKEVADELRDQIKTMDGTTNVKHDMKDLTLQYEIDVDNDKASNLGITKYDIQRQINIALYGATASSYRKDGKEYDIVVESNIEDVDEIENIRIKSSITNKKIPLKQFANVRYGYKIDGVNRYNEDLTIQIKSDVLPKYNSVAIANKIENEILPTMDTDGVKIIFQGEREDIESNFGIVGILAGLAVFIIYVILVVQFDSFVQPMVILTTIPLSLIGSILGLFILNQPLSLTAFLGIIALIGLVVKNGILLIEYINNAIDEGYSVDEACIDAVDKRYNAIVLSAGTTIMGLIPLAIAGSSLFAPMAVSLMAGLFVSTFLTMVIIPVIYSFMATILEKTKKKETTV